MSIVELANIFEMSTIKFAALTGYSRQAWYGNQIAYTERSIAMLNKLRDYSDLLYSVDLESASNKRKQREAAIKALEERLQKR